MKLVASNNCGLSVTLADSKRVAMVGLQGELFRVAGLPMVDNCMAGYNSCMFAYGQVLCLHNLT